MKRYAARLAFVGLIASPAMASVSDTPQHLHRVFDVVRKGSNIGIDVLDVSRQGTVTIAKMTTHLAVKIAFITVYRYDHSETAKWKGSQLLSFDAATDDNGKDHKITAALSNGKIDLDTDGKMTTVAKTIVPASVWSADVSTKPDMFDPADGRDMAVEFRDLGHEAVMLNGVSRNLDHVRLSGDFSRELWFDDQGLVKMTLVGSDNSTVSEELRQSTASR